MLVQKIKARAGIIRRKTLKRGALEFSASLGAGLPYLGAKPHIMAAPRQLSMDDFEIIMELGSGTFGAIIHARNKITGEEVAIKKIKCKNERAQQIAQHEIEIRKQLKFRYIANFKDSFTEVDQDGKITFCLVMEYCNQGSLYDYIKRKKEEGLTVEEDFAWQILAQLILGINYIHSLTPRLLRRDLKPGNIFLTGTDDDLEVRIGDFGFSKQLDPDKSFLESQKGTLNYFSPEILALKQFRISGGVWGIGVIIYELLTFEPPFVGIDYYGTLCKIVSYQVQPFPIPERFTEPLRQIVNASLVKDHNVRIPLNVLVTIPSITLRIKDLANRLVGESSGTAKTYLEHLISDIDTKGQDLPQRDLIRIIDFEVKYPQISRRYPGQPGKHLVSLEMMQMQESHTVTVVPELLAGDGVVRIAVKFEYSLNEEMGYRCIEVVDSSFEVPQKYYPGQDGGYFFRILALALFVHLIVIEI
ncbi:MAG: putative Serine/threonine protein kinase [Streblomastix strix]|uniref:non-specific serine/threonine protein kinase n=1 Tax=Streblomastix strix TaxID=222440 RepID=A0A5J4VNQ4_9EUKA|nr:MAG: putative Serine/threonine protein kinase [Streblomastix strix]